MWGIQRKQRDTTFIIILRANCLWLETVSFQKQFISKENSGSKVFLEEVKEPQIITEDTNEIQDDSQEVVDSESVTQGP